MHTTFSSWTAACLSLSLLPTASAFYPYSFPSKNVDNTGTQRRTPNSQPARGSLSLPIRRVNRPRDNVYNIVNSKDPKQKNSVAIDQDGSDLSYMVAVTLGDSKEEYHLLLDSAASNTWVMGQDCPTEACKTHNLFGEGDSSTLEIDTETFDITYGTGSVKGNLASDTLHLGPLSPELNFGLATNVSDEFRAYPMDGILGIGRGDKSQVFPQVVEVLKSSNLIGSKLYGIHMSRSKDGLNDGELNFGEPNKDRYDGDLNWIEVIDNDAGFWEIKLGDAGVNGEKIGFEGISGIMDTGTSFILMPEEHAVSFHDFIDGTTQSGETFFVPCDTTQNMFMEFGGKQYNISTADWVGPKQKDGSCRSNIIGRKTFGDKQWLVGDTFLKNVYSVFDFDNKQVGLGVKGAASAGNTPSTTGTSGTPTSTGELGSSATGTSTNENTNHQAEASPASSTTPEGAGVRSTASTSSFALMVAVGLLAMYI